MRAQGEGCDTLGAMAARLARATPLLALLAPILVGSLISQGERVRDSLIGLDSRPHSGCIGPPFQHRIEG